jgi:hypothetical protein
MSARDLSSRGFSRFCHSGFITPERPADIRLNWVGLSEQSKWLLWSAREFHENLDILRENKSVDRVNKTAKHWGDETKAEFKFDAGCDFAIRSGTPSRIGTQNVNLERKVAVRFASKSCCEAVHGEGKSMAKNESRDAAEPRQTLQLSATARPLF